MATDAYKAAGVDVEAGYESVRLIKDDVKRTAIEGVLGGIAVSAVCLRLEKAMRIRFLFPGQTEWEQSLKSRFLWTSMIR